MVAPLLGLPSLDIRGIEDEELFEIDAQDKNGSVFRGGYEAYEKVWGVPHTRVQG